MSNRMLLSVPIALAGLLGAVVWLTPVLAQVGPPGPRPEERGPGGPGERPSVNRSMKGMARALRELKDQAGDAAMTEDSLRLIGDFQRSCVAAKSQPVPADLLEKAGGAVEQERMAKEFRGELIKVLRLALDLESDLLEGRHAAAVAKCEELVMLRDHGHEELGVVEE